MERKQRAVLMAVELHIFKVDPTMTKTGRRKKAKRSCFTEEVNLVNAAIDVCLQDSSVSSMLSREELCKRAKDYLEDIAKMKKRPKAERDANRLLKMIRARVNPLNAWIKTNFESTSLAYCRERELIWTAFDQGILKSLLVDHMEASVHGLSTSRNPLNWQNDEELTANSNQYDELQVLCDLYEQERIDEPVGISENL
ncbi:hypothetical protein I305_01610 [Cryptococcus gattii E566]|uniref:Uncharacterized protein n=2 Tax=Cryptococcus gattii TaxID=37769 RepID=E6R9Y8_CRYGW|nr:Hypothetical protein CGB_G5600W [Cryptococcus gattii WM276]ADV23599.1 Hypothetical protein CGB_G5600W [Cryptococcus gattii WM276]KIR77728.1 hypothetical protein I306_05464 [Cryptococcus gattii EJB2]KIY36034.1 hypothetical protein I305_01610 [Cryptococcus gattii E566]KJE05532.1 hypothetical protein I311_00738 [Cryptococcus gattii NT-10]